MNDQPRRELRPAAPDGPAGDDSYAQAYANGYGEGLRESLRELLGHITRGHTVAEIRILVESRLARVAEDVELKRKSLTGPPQRTPWNALLKPRRPAGPPEASGPTGLPDWVLGQSYLFREERPEHAPRFVQRSAVRHDGIVWVSHHAPPELGVPADRIVHLRPTGHPTGDGTTAGIGPGEVAGQIQTVHDAKGSILVYTDALEYLLTEYGAEPTVRFAMWLGPWAQENRSTTVVSLDPGAMEERDLRRVLKAFTTLA